MPPSRVISFNAIPENKILAKNFEKISKMLYFDAVQNYVICMMVHIR